MEPTDYPQAQTTVTYGQTANATSYRSLPLVILLQLPSRHTVSLSRGTALMLKIPPLLWSLPPGLCTAQSAYGTQPAYPTYGQHLAATTPA